MAVLLPMNGILRTSISFVPDLEVLSAYGLFFGFGWVLYLQRDLLASFDRFAWLQTAAAVLIFLIVDSMIPPDFSAEGTSIISIGMTVSAMGASVVWLLFFGFTGLFLRYLNRPSAAVRYVVDSSYWIYLVHLPFTIWVPGLLSGLTWSPWAKIAVVFSVTSLFGVITYDLFVRSSIIGAVLNGRRYPRGLPPLELIEPGAQQAQTYAN